MIDNGRAFKSNWPWVAGAVVSTMCAGTLMAATGQPEQADAQRPDVREVAPQAPVPIDLKQLDAIVRDLDSPDVKKRLNASQRLNERSDIRLRDLEPILQRNDLSAEQRRRLLSAAEWRFRSEPRAALGFQGPNMMGERDVQGVTITNTIPGFPAADVLRPNDRIISADGAPLASFAAIRPVIVSRDPGDKLQLTIIRAGATMNVTVELGSFGQLPQGNELDQAVLAEAWEVRSQRLRGPHVAPVPSGLPSDKWETERLEVADLDDLEIVPGGARNAVRIGLVMGGEPRVNQERGTMQVLHMLSNPNALEPDMARDPLVVHINRLQTLISQWEMQKNAIERMLASDQIGEEQRRGLEQNRAGLAQAIENQEVEIQRLVNELVARHRR